MSQCKIQSRDPGGHERDAEGIGGAGKCLPACLQDKTCPCRALAFRPSRVDGLLRQGKHISSGRCCFKEEGGTRGNERLPDGAEETDAERGTGERGGREEGGGGRRRAQGGETDQESNPTFPGTYLPTYLD